MTRKIIVCDVCQKEFEEETSVYATLYISKGGRVESSCDICENCMKKVYDRDTTTDKKLTKAEAIKEFAERVIKEGEKNVDYYTPEGCDLYFRNGTMCGYSAMRETIILVAKEMGVEL